MIDNPVFEIVNETVTISTLGENTELAIAAAEDAQNALASVSTTVSEVSVLKDQTVAAKDAAVVAQLAAEAAASGPGISVVSGVGYMPRPTTIGYTPGNTRYEMNAGGLPVFDQAVLQIASVGLGVGTPSLVEMFRFEADTKPLIVQLGKNQGDGIPGSANFSKKTTGGERLVLVGFYGGKDALSTETAFAHAGYITVNAEADNDGSNEQRTVIAITPGRTTGVGGGIQTNSLGQTALVGPDLVNYIWGQDYGAILKIGPGSSAMPPIQLTLGALKTTATLGSVEYNIADGEFYITKGTSTPSRELVTSCKPFTLGSLPASGVTSSVRTGPDWIELTMVVGGADITVFNGSIFFSPVLSAIPVATFSWGGGDFTEDLNFSVATATNKISTSLRSGTLKAGQTYKLNYILRVV